ncbi:MAG TPA: hypothetical protein VGO82_06290 [Enterovirga sp.]|nr:hypothetical protein [Enterovirga sp.]
MAYDGAGTLFALGIRVTKLGPNGAPLVGAGNAYVSDALVKTEIGLEYEDAKQVTQLNGTGVACVNYQAPYTLKRGSIKGLQICTPDPNLTQFLIGGEVIVDAATPANQIGYRAPQTGVEEVPDGVSLEFWSRAVIGSALANTLPFFHWILPRAYLVPAGSWVLGGTEAMIPEFDGYSVQNAGWGTGPEDDFDYPSDRVWQYVREATLPDLDAGLVPVVAQVP